MYTLLDRLSEFLNTLCKKAGAALLGAMAVLIVIQVAARYVVGSSLSWSEEISRYLFIWVVMLGTVICVREGSHVAVEFILKRLPPSLYRLVSTGFTICLFVLAVVMVLYGSILAASVHEQLSPATRISMSCVYAAVPVCSLVMLVHLAVQLMRDLTGKAGGRN